MERPQGPPTLLVWYHAQPGSIDTSPITFSGPPQGPANLKVLQLEHLLQYTVRATWREYNCPSLGFPVLDCSISLSIRKSITLKSENLTKATENYKLGIFKAQGWGQLGPPVTEPGVWEADSFVGP